MGLNAFGISSPAASELFTAMIAKYREVLAQRVEPWARSVSGWTSTAELRQKFPIDLTAFAGFREWIGPRKSIDGEIASFFIDSKPWERTIDVPLDILGAKAFGPYINKVPLLMRAADAHPNVLLAKLMLGGKTANCWDGASFFSASHPVDYRGVNTSTLYSNLKTALPFNKANFAKAKQVFRAMKAPDGITPLGLRLTHVLGGTDMEETFDALFKKVLISSDAQTPGTSPVASETNIYYGGAQPIIAPELDANNEAGVWYGLALNTDARPFETQMKDDGAPDIRIFADGSEFASEHNEMRFAGKLFGNAGYAIPHSIIRFEPT